MSLYTNVDLSDEENTNPIQSKINLSKGLNIAFKAHEMCFGEFLP